MSSQRLKIKVQRHHEEDQSIPLLPREEQGEGARQRHQELEYTPPPFLSLLWWKNSPLFIWSVTLIGKLCNFCRY